jgi:phosphoribosyl 1,2-cyclic phosphodiesterase
VRVIPLGVRGSTAAPGAAFVRYGGHTSCVAVTQGGVTAPQLVLDAGTGLSALPELLGGAAFTGQVVLSHLHWDHVQGLPFCSSVDRPDARVRMHVPVASADGDPVELLSRAFSPPHFPIGPDGLQGDWRFLPLVPGAVDETITVAPIAHKGGTAFGVRVTLDGATFAYLPDHALHRDTSAADRESASALVQDVDLLLHDGQFVTAEEDVAVRYGHAVIEDVLRMADRCRVGGVALTHHGPSRTDDELDALAAQFRRTPEGRPVVFARQGAAIDVVNQH